MWRLSLHRENAELVPLDSPVAAAAHGEMYTSGDGSVRRAAVVRSSPAVHVVNTQCPLLLLRNMRSWTHRSHDSRAAVM